jgi:tetratricopeptide (TPR) repeat protein
MQTAWLSVTVASTALLATPDAARLQQALALEANDETAALAALDALVKAEPVWELARLEDARLRLKRGEGLEIAQLHLEAARSYAPENPRAHFLWGQLMEERHDNAAALAAYQVALTIRPTYDEAQFRAAGLHFQLGEWASALEKYKAYAATHPEATGARLQLAAAAEKAGSPKVAEQELKKLYEVPASRTIAGRRLAEFYERTGHAGAAAKIRKEIEPPARKLRELPHSGR